MTDITTRLRNAAQMLEFGVGDTGMPNLMKEAAQEIDRQQEKVAQANHVISYLWRIIEDGSNGRPPIPSEMEMIAAKDYFFMPDEFDENFKPWPEYD